MTNTPQYKPPMFQDIDTVKNLKVDSVTELKNKMLRVNLTFNTSEFGPISVRGFRVGPSIQYKGFWVQPPSTFPFKVDIFRVEMGVWKVIEEFLVNLYKGHAPDNDEAIDVDQVIKDMET